MTHPTSIACPYCKRLAGEWCKDPRGNAKRNPHRVRVKAFHKILKAGEEQIPHAVTKEVKN